MRRLFVVSGALLVAAGVAMTHERLERLVAPDGEITQVGYVLAARIAVAAGGVVVIALGILASTALLQRVAVMAAAATMPFLGLEAVLRVLTPPEGPRFDPSVLLRSSEPELMWENTPGWVLEKDQGSKRHNERMVYYNSLGLRDEERQYSRTRETIVVVGDSIEAWDTPVMELYPRRLESKLNATGDRAPVQVLNFGAFGYSLHQKLLTLKRRGLEWRPTHVIVGYCLNDPIPSSEYVAYFANRPRPLLSLLSVRLLNDRVRAVSRGFGSDFHVQIHDPAGAPWAGVVADLQTLAALGKEHRFDVTLLLFPLMYDTRADYPWAEIHQRVGEVATSAGIEVIDLLDRFRDAGFEAVRDDPVHPSTRGHEIAAEALYERFIRQTASENTK